MAARNHPTALITGASLGLGFEFAHIFAQNNYNLIVVARNKTKLQELAKELTDKYKVSVKVIVKDLSLPRAGEEIYKEVQKNHLKVDVLVNNAGFATHGLFTQTDLQEEIGEINLNVLTLTVLTKLFVQEMVKRKKGKILNVASTAAFQPGPLMAVYYATKAYVLSFSEALANELTGTGVSVTTLCPGPTRTNFTERAKMDKTLLFKLGSMNAHSVALAGFKGLLEEERVVVPGVKNNMLVVAAKLSPRDLTMKVVKRMQQ